MISKKLKIFLINIAKKYKLDLIVLFGSRSVKQERENSDWDFAIYSKNSLNFDTYLEILNEIEGEYFEKIDLVNLNELEDPLLSKNIFEKGICLFESKKDLFLEMQNTSLFEYLDFKPLFKIEEEILLKKMENL